MQLKTSIYLTGILGFLALLVWLDVIGIPKINVGAWTAVAIGAVILIAIARSPMRLATPLAIGIAIFAGLLVITGTVNL